MTQPEGQFHLEPFSVNDDEVLLLNGYFEKLATYATWEEAIRVLTAAGATVGPEFVDMGDIKCREVTFPATEEA
jgi:hypothetical protein